MDSGSSQATINDTREIKTDSECDNSNGSEISSEHTVETRVMAECIDSESPKSLPYALEKGNYVNSSHMTASVPVNDNTHDSHTNKSPTIVNDDSIQNNIPINMPSTNKYTVPNKLVVRKPSDYLAGNKHTLQTHFPAPKKKRKHFINSNTLDLPETNTLIVTKESPKCDSDSSYSPLESEDEDNTVGSSASDNDDNVQESLSRRRHTEKNTDLTDSYVAPVVHTLARQPNARYCPTSSEQKQVSFNVQQKSKPIYIFMVNPEIYALKGIGGDRNRESSQHSSREYIFSKITCDQIAERSTALHDKLKSSSIPVNDGTSTKNAIVLRNRTKKYM